GDGSGRVAFGETHIFVGPRYVLSVRHGPSVSYTEVRARCESTPSLLRKGPGFVLYAIMDFVVDHYFPIIDALEDELDALAEAHWRWAYPVVGTLMVGTCVALYVRFKRAGWL